MNTETTKTMNTETNIKITVKKTRAAASGWKDRGATWREPARYGIYVDGKLRAEIIGEDGGFMGATVWEVKLPWDSGRWEPVSFYERYTYTRGIGERREGFRRFKARIVANPSPVLAAIETAEARVEAMRVQKAQAQQAKVEIVQAENTAREIAALLERVRTVDGDNNTAVVEGLRAAFTAAMKRLGDLREKR